MLTSRRDARLLACWSSVALGLLACAAGGASAVSVRAGTAAHPRPFTKVCPPGTDPKLPGNCLLSEGFDPCSAPSNAGCVRVGEVGLHPAPTVFKIAVSPSVVPIGGSLTVTLSPALAHCPFPITRETPRCVASVAFGDPRQRQSYLPLNYSAIFNPPLLRFPAACVGDAAPLSCNATVLRGFGPRRLLTDHHMIAGATIELGGGGTSHVDYLEAAVGVSSAPPVRLSGTVSGFTGPVAGETVDAVQGHDTTTATTDAHGHYQFELLRGRYTVAISGGIWTPAARRVALRTNRSGVDFAESRAGHLEFSAPGPGFDVISFGFTNPSAVTGPGNSPGSARGDVHLVVTKLQDASSAELFRDAMSGHVFPSATLTSYRPGTSNIVAIYTLRDVTVTGVQSRTAGAVAFESVDLTAGSETMAVPGHR